MPHKILLADDSVTVQRVVELTFANEGMQVITAADGRQAIERLERDVPDIALVDVGLPGLDGYGVAGHVKAAAHLAHIPVVLMTGAFEQVDDARASRAACAGVLAKPFEPDMAIALVRRILGLPADATGGAAPAGLASGDSAVNGTAAGYPFEDTPAGHTASLDEYFDKLDEALAASPGGRAETSPHQPARPAEKDRSPQDDTAPPDAGALSLADAFSALLADELSDGSVLPAAADRVARRNGPDALDQRHVSDALVEAVARRVLERLTDQIVRDAVSARVDEIAERLVREEIERLKSQA